MEVTFLSVQHLEAFADHRGRLIFQSGKNGNPIFNPYDSTCVISNSDLKKNRALQWAKPIQTSGWLRSWGLFDRDRIIASVELVGGKIETGLHRAVLMMGIEDGYKGQGLGKDLLKHSVSWATENQLSWIDLAVFANNEIAVSLYKSFGFLETGRVVDSFRVYGQSITDIQMSLKL